MQKYFNSHINPKSSSPPKKTQPTNQPKKKPQTTNKEAKKYNSSYASKQLCQ